MPTGYTPTAERTAMTIPSGPDGVNLALLLAAVKAGANRAEWASKELVDVKHATTTSAANTVSSTTFVDAASLASLTFTEVEVGDLIVLYGALSVSCPGTNGIGARWLAGATDVTLAGGEYPKCVWGTSATDQRTLAVMSVHEPAAAAASLVAKLQYRIDVGSGAAVTNPYAKIVGVHFRLGAA